MTVMTEPNTRREAWWRAVLERDAAYDGAFVIGVRTTGIYCRPSCPARKPKRENVVFLSAPEEAEAQGFRACKRCHPQRAVPPEVAAVRRVCAHIDAHLDEPLTLARLGEVVGWSAHHLQRVFKGVLGVSPKEYADARRLERLKDGLRDGGDVTRAIYAAGYGSSSRVYGRAAGKLGMTPGQYGKCGAGMAIVYAVVDCPLGRLLVAATPKGVCKVSLGDEDEALEADLRAHYHAAELTRRDDALGRWVGAILAYLRGDRRELDLPIDVRATAFQWRVWSALQKIPYGATRSYAEVARALGRPGAARAVAGACARNPVALVTPCHRVVRGNGALGGYRWGLERKRALLEREAEAA